MAGVPRSPPATRRRIRERAAKEMEMETDEPAASTSAVASTSAPPPRIQPTTPEQALPITVTGRPKPHVCSHECECGPNQKLCPSCSNFVPCSYNRSTKAYSYPAKCTLCRGLMHAHCSDRVSEETAAKTKVKASGLALLCARCRPLSKEKRVKFLSMDEASAYIARKVRQLTSESIKATEDELQRCRDTIIQMEAARAADRQKVLAGEIAVLERDRLQEALTNAGTNTAVILAERDSAAGKLRELSAANDELRRQLETFTDHQSNAHAAASEVTRLRAMLNAAEAEKERLQHANRNLATEVEQAAASIRTNEAHHEATRARLRAALDASTHRDQTIAALTARVAELEATIEEHRQQARQMTTAATTISVASQAATGAPAQPDQAHPITMAIVEQLSAIAKRLDGLEQRQRTANHPAANRPRSGKTPAEVRMANQPAANQPRSRPSPAKKRPAANQPSCDAPTTLRPPANPAPTRNAKRRRIDTADAAPPPPNSTSGVARTGPAGRSKSKRSTTQNHRRTEATSTPHQSRQTFAELVAAHPVQKTVVATYDSSRMAAVRDRIKRDAALNARSRHPPTHRQLGNRASTTIRCLSEEAATHAIEHLNSTYEGVTACHPQEDKPALKLVRIPSVSVEELHTMLVQENPALAQLEFAVDTIFTINLPTANYKNAVLTAQDLATHAQLARLGSLTVGGRRKALYEIVHILQCVNCQQFGHSVKVCTNATACRRCAQLHSIAQCTSEEIKCLNCANANATGARLPTNHCTTSGTCPIKAARIRGVSAFLLKNA